MSNFPHLEYFFGCYLHQDWPDEYADEWAALDDLIASDPHQLPGLLSDLHELLDRPMTDAHLGEAVADMGSEFLADWDGGTYRGWLEEVARRIEAATT